MKFTAVGHTNKLNSNMISCFINPGEFYFGEENCQINTLLGSCIAITLWHPRLKIGGMCHFVLPKRSNFDIKNSSYDKLDGRYSGDAMVLFEKHIVKYFTKFTEYQAKIFGGSNMLSNSTLQEEQLVGNRNTVAAMQLLSDKEIPLLVAHVGETGARRISFDVANGDVWVKHDPLKKNIL